MKLQLRGVGLFGFIPLVLWLYVGHPEPLAASLVVGVALMLGHRLLARPYMHRVVSEKCLWCNAVPVGEPAESVSLETGAGTLPARCCPGHGEPAARFFAALERFRWPLRLGIFLPLLGLLAALTAATFGADRLLPTATDVFRLVVGLTVNLAAWSYLWTPPVARPRVPFPAHNFFLLGVRALLWIFRIVGIWWIYVGARGLLG